MKQFLMTCFLALSINGFCQESSGYLISYGAVFKSTNSGVNWSYMGSSPSDNPDQVISFVQSQTSYSDELIDTLNTNKIVRIIDYIGRETIPQSNVPFIEIYDDGSVVKKVIVE